MRIPSIEKQIPTKGANATFSDKVLVVKGAKGELKRVVSGSNIQIEITPDAIVVKASNATKRDKMHIGTLVAHIRNMVTGVVDGFTYKLKVCASHFPMTVTLEKDVLVVKNFLGESVPRRVRIKPNASVNVSGSDITIESVDKELAGQVAADIEQLMRRPGFDRRIFQDGIYIVAKGDKTISL